MDTAFVRCALRVDSDQLANQCSLTRIYTTSSRLLISLVYNLLRIDPY